MSELVKITIEPPLDEDGLFLDTGKYDEIQEAHTRQTAARISQYADSGCGNPRTLDKNGRYLCGGYKGHENHGCNKFRIGEEQSPGSCLIVEGDINPTEGSCPWWESYYAGDAELKYARPFTKQIARYSERPGGEGYSCMRCEYGQDQAKKSDSQGRNRWCKFYGMRVEDSSCCAENDAVGDIEFSGNKPEKPKKGRDNWKSKWLK